MYPWGYMYPWLGTSGIDHEEEWCQSTPLSESNTHGEQLRFNYADRTQTSEQEYSDLMARHWWTSSRVNIWAVVLRPGRNPYWVSFSFGSIISLHTFFKALGIHFSREAKYRDALVISAFFPVFLLVYGYDHPSLPIIQCPSRTPAHLTHTSQPKNCIVICRLIKSRNSETARGNLL